MCHVRARVLTFTVEDSPRHRLGLALLLSIGLAASAAATTVTYNLTFGPEATGATGSGSGAVVYDDGAHTLAINVSWSGTSGPSTVAHIHCCVATPGSGTVGIAVSPSTLPGFPNGVTSGSYTTLLDLRLTTTYQPAFLTLSGGTASGAEAALKAGMDSGRAYFNIHTSTFPGGEIRAFLTVPEPALAGLLGVAGLARVGRRRRA